MKKQLLATLVLIVSVFATATAANKKETNTGGSQKISLSGHFTRLVVDGNVDVVLFEDNGENNIRTFGNPADIAATSITEKNGVLTVKSNASGKEKVLVYVPVSNLQIVEASGNSKVSSASPLSSALLLLILKGDCHFNIQSKGAIELMQDGDVELMVEKSIASRRV